MRWKVALLLLMIFFASTMITVAVSFGAPKSTQRGMSERVTLYTKYYPTGDPIDGSSPPHMLT